MRVHTGHLYAELVLGMNDAGIKEPDTQINHQILEKGVVDRQQTGGYGSQNPL